MTELETKLSQILEEKQNKIIPENIKKGIQIFDIEGTYEGNSGGVKLFETEEQMQQDLNANEGDLAVVYREEIQNMTADSQTQYITFPETVTLPQALTESYYCRLRATDPSKMFDGNIMLDQNSFRFDGYSESDMIRVQYSSSDGITYTRTRFSGDSGDLTNPVDLGTVVQCEPMEGEWDDNFGYFMQIGGSTFEGLYEYSLYIDKENVHSILVSDMSFDYNPTNGITNIAWNGNKYSILNIPSIIELYNKIKEDTELDLWHIAIDENDNLILFDLKNYNYVCGDIAFDPNKNQLGICSPNERDYDYILSVATLDLESKSYTIQDYNISGNVYVNVYKYNWSYFPIKLKTLTYRINSSNNKITCNNYFVVGDSTTGDRENYRGNSPLIPESLNGLYVEEYKYIPASTQLTAITDKVYNSIYYGKDGVNEGTLTQNVSNSFADINAEVYSKIQQVYNNMEPRILTDGDKEIDQNIHFIPTKLDGTPLLDTSNVTDMYVMFFKCENLTSIPQLNTSNVTNMNGTFENCTNLKTIANLNTSKVENMNSIFDGCENLISVPQFDTSSVIYMGAMFSRCQSLVEVPQFDTSKVTKMGSMFIGCTNLVTVPQFDMSSIVYSNLFNHDIQNMFSRCPSLSSDSLNNILKSLLTATSYTETKTLAYIGLSEEQATTCTTLSNWSALEAKGWTTGY